MSDNDWLVIVLGIVAIVILYMIVTATAPEPAVLLFGVQPPIIRYGDSIQATVVVSNRGGEARNAQVELSSMAVSSYISNPTVIEAHSNGTLVVSLRASDVANGEYEMAIWITYEDSKGQNSTPHQIKEVYVLPAVEITNVGWEKTGNVWPWDQKSTIRTIDATTLNFTVHSLSRAATYENLVASAANLLNARNLTITPGSIRIEPIGPGGTTEIQYSFHIQSNDTPVGKYQIGISIVSDDHVTTTYTVDFTVS